MIGTSILHYEIQSELGRGGMGVVYKAEDRKLHRLVALKVLSNHLLNSEDDRARFYREARSAAQLNHPNIATVYAVDETVDDRGDPHPFIAMEFIDGRTLRKVIDVGPLKLEDAIRITKEIAAALHVAHQKDIVHRDIKSANVMMTDGGVVKVLDFGLAKTAQSTMLTKTGSTLGTAAYMSPEQTSSNNVDHRSDLWSLGVVLYEMVAGRLPFGAEYEQAMMYAILNEDPEPLTAIRTGVPIELDRIVAKCLMKDPKLRYQHADDLVADLTAIQLRGATRVTGTTTLSTTRHATLPSMKPARGKRALIPAIAMVLGILAGAGLGPLLWKSKPATMPAPYKLSIALPNGVRLPTGEGAPLNINRRLLAMSPDGSKLAYVGWDGSETRLYLRPLDAFESTPLPGTEGAYRPFFSPDGNWIAFYAGDEMKRTPADGSGNPLVVGPVVLPAFGVWGPENKIVFGNSEGERVSEVDMGGGSPKEIKTGLSAWSGFLDESHVIGWNEVLGLPKIAIESTEDGVLQDLGIVGASPARVDDRLVYSLQGDIFSVPFDWETRKTTGQPKRIVGGVWSRSNGIVQFSVARTGIVAYVPGGRDDITTFAWVGREGGQERLPFSAEEYGMFQLSPQGDKIVVSWPSSIDARDIWVLDVERSTKEQITDGGFNFYPSWTPDGERVVFGSCDTEGCRLVSSPVGSSGGQEILADGPLTISSISRSANGLVAFGNLDDVLVALPIEGTAKGAKVDTLVEASLNSWGPSLSPDGSLLAYTSIATKQAEIIVQPYPTSGRRWQVSVGGGEEPIWSPDGKELFYRYGPRLFSVQVARSSDGVVSFGQPTVVYEGNLYNVPGISYDVGPDGRFLILESAESPVDLRHIRVASGW